MRILYAEDEHGLSDAVGDVLRFHKYNVDIVDNGKDALAYALAQSYDGVILDIMLPGMDGLSVLTELRGRGNRVPIMLLTAKDEVEDRITGFDLGADDYLPKPFAMTELLARIRALLRRRDSFTPDVLQVGSLVLDQKQAVLSCNGGTQSLSRLEFQLIELMMRHPRMSFSSEYLLEQIWGFDSEADVSVVWVYISYLRKKLSALHADVYIQSKRSVGYSLEVIK